MRNDVIFTLNIFPVSVDDSKFASLFGHLSDDVFGGEDRLQVQPSCLALKPQNPIASLLLHLFSFIVFSRRVFAIFIN